MNKLDCYMSSAHMRSYTNWLLCLDNAKTMGFDGVELFAGENGTGFESMSDERCMEIAQHAKDIGIKISVHPWFYWTELPQTELNSKYRDLVKRCIDMEVTDLNMHLQFLSTRKQGMERVFSATDAVTDLLQESNLRLLYENVPGDQARTLGSEVIDFDRLFRRYAPETNIMLNIDSGHAHIMRQILPLAQDYGYRWKYTHLHDNNGLEDQHTAPGTGTLDFKQFAKLAAEAGCHGTLMMEYHQDGLAQGMTVLKEAYAEAGFELPDIKPMPKE